MSPRFTGRPDIVTAAGSGIGRAIALRLHVEGAKVLAVDMKAESLSQLLVSGTLRTLQANAVAPDTPQTAGRLTTSHFYATIVGTTPTSRPASVYISDPLVQCWMDAHPDS